MEPGQHCRDLVRFALEDDFNRPVRKVANPTAEAEMPGLAFRIITKKYTLDPAMNNGMYTFNWCHDPCSLHSSR